MNGYRSEQEVIQNLKDAGCDEDTIQCFMQQLQRGRQTHGIHLLQKHRCCLLDTLHRNQKQIDCLDYLLFMLKKKSEK